MDLSNATATGLQQRNNSSVRVIFWELGARTARAERLAATAGVVGQNGARQREYRDREQLATLERERVRDQRDQDVRRQWSQDIMVSWQEEKKAQEQRIQDVNAERDRDRETSQNMQKFQAGRLRDLRRLQPCPKFKRRVQRSPLIRQLRMQRLSQVTLNLQPRIQRQIHMSHVTQVAVVRQGTKVKLRLNSSERPTNRNPGPGHDVRPKL
ncbi:hypothetical protein PC121_g18111 [Phytophthora cactorum]|nr:hypothetical protein PC120_g17619 [Phytophthora cactorum]KAG3050927.1 hypothetical protein PC121_g18111 [Phytophthora cactorum]KAG4046538.1 hypothetical protein PC123_g18082 [Phytophthora cactorum]